MFNPINELVEAIVDFTKCTVQTVTVEDREMFERMLDATIRVESFEKAINIVAETKQEEINSYFESVSK